VERQVLWRLKRLHGRPYTKERLESVKEIAMVLGRNWLYNIRVGKTQGGLSRDKHCVYINLHIRKGMQGKAVGLKQSIYASPVHTSHLKENWESQLKNGPCHLLIQTGRKPFRQTIGQMGGLPAHIIITVTRASRRGRGQGFWPERGG